MEDLVSKIVNYGLEKGADFVDVRIEDYSTVSIDIREGIPRISSSITNGASIRVLYKGALGFAATSSISEEGLVKALNSALRQARALSGKSKPIDFYRVSSRHDYVKEDIIVDPRNVPIDVKTKDLLELNRSIYSLNEKIKALTIRYMDTVGKTIYGSSEDRYIEQEYSYTWLYIWATGREGDILVSARETAGTRKGYVLFKKYDVNKLAEKIASRINKQLKAKTPKGGIFPVVLSPEVVGTFAHEAFGHLAEADLTMSGSILKGKVGHKVASEHVTIIDDPTIPDAFGTFKYDDEGVEAMPVVIVEKGVLKQLMTNRLYAKLLNTKPTGNARAQDYNVPPLIRMRTTYIKPGDMEKEELFEGIKFGYYIVGFLGGQANLDGTFQVGVQEAYEIVNGEIGEPVRNMSISGNTIETLFHVSGVGKDFEIRYGICGKGQSIFVSDGGPHIRVDKIMVGGRT